MVDNAGAPGQASGFDPQQLPPEPTAFENQVDALASLDSPGVEGAVVHHVIGPAGCGKSATVLHWANRRVDRFPDGRIYLDLRGHNRAHHIMPHEALAKLLTARRVDPQTLPDDTAERAALWRSATFGQKLLVILDNAADSDQVEDLLCTGPDTVTVVTSRNFLAEIALLPTAHITKIDLLTPEYALSLLKRLVEPRRGPMNDADLAELARLCGHLQLALRVAAQRLIKSPLLSAAELNAELRERGRILGQVKAVFDSSCHDLSPETSRLFRHLGVAPGSDLAFEAICALSGTSVELAREHTEELLNSHLLDTSVPGRFRVHDLLHAYAAELAASPEHSANADAALDRLGRWYVSTATEAARSLGSELHPQLPTHPSSIAIAHWYSAESQNLEIMVAALLARGLTQRALELCIVAADLLAFYNADAWPGIATTGLRLATDAGDVPAQSWFHESLGRAHLQSGDLPSAQTAHETSLELRRRLGNKQLQTRSLNALGLVYWRAGNLDAAESHFSTCRTLATEGGDHSFETFAIMNLGLVALSRARRLDPGERTPHYEAAKAFLDTALEGLDPTSSFYRAHALSDRAESLAGLGQLGPAHTDAQEAIALARETGSPLVLVTALRASARVYIQRHDTRNAQTNLLEALKVLRQHHNPQTIDVIAELGATGWDTTLGNNG